MSTSLWAATRTFFPLFFETVQREPTISSVAVVGAADGKFVAPLAKAGYEVTAVDVNGSALFGTDGASSGQPEEAYDSGGLAGLVRQARLEDRVTIIEGDVRELEVPPCDAVWTSCSWHYSLNHDQPLDVFIDALTRCVKHSGILGAEYFMPVSAAHVASEHYLEQGAIWSYLAGWSPTWDAYTPAFVEQPHLAQPRPHIHRMGFVVARRRGRESDDMIR
ncbi:class I SAM-dependent methyltransferase [Amycolatopsis samaneae]|uniref:Class I SAM-dependent methyltransferase n=1 Tax=Amycolatopsis samaneae TaxID=664691 RepID=A0ABW5GI85_9PSEU